MTDSTFDPHPRLPVFTIVGRSLGYVFAHWRLMALPFIALALAGVLFQHFLLQHMGGLPAGHEALDADNLPSGLDILRGNQSSQAIFGADMLMLLVQFSFIVGVHRTILLDEARSGITFFRFDGNWGYYILNWFVITMIFLGGGILFGAILGGGWAIAYLEFQAEAGAIIGVSIAAVIGLVVLVFLTMRLSLSFPAAALGETGRFKLSWHATRGSVWRLFWIVLLISLPLGVLELPMAIHSIGAMAAAKKAHVSLMAIPVPAWIEIWSGIVRIYFMVAYTVSLSLAYDVLVRRKSLAVPLVGI